MADPLITYIQDHLAGALFAVGLLGELRQQDYDTEVAQFATQLLAEVEDDRSTLKNLAERLGDQSDSLKDAAAWVAQKASSVKLDLESPLGVFEAIEMLSLGVLGKLALWNALQTIRTTNENLSNLDLDQLKVRAERQHRELEALRLKLAATTLGRPAS